MLFSQIIPSSQYFFLKQLSQLLHLGVLVEIEKNSMQRNKTVISTTECHTETLPGGLPTSGP